MTTDESGASAPGTADRQGSAADRRGRAPTDPRASRTQGWQASLSPVLDFLLVFAAMVAVATLTASFLVL